MKRSSMFYAHRDLINDLIIVSRSKKTRDCVKYITLSSAKQAADRILLLITVSLKLSYSETAHKKQKQVFTGTMIVFRDRIQFV